MCMQDAPLEFRQPLSPSQIADLRLAASKMTGPKRRAFQAEMTLKYCGGNPLLAENIFGWGRHTVEVGLAERRTGIMCLGAQSAFSGRKRWEDKHPASGRGPSPTGRSPCATRPDVSHDPGLYAADGQSGSGGLESPRLSRGPIALAKYDGRRAQPDGLSAPQSGQSQAAKEDCRDRRHFRQH